MKLWWFLTVVVLLSGCLVCKRSEKGSSTPTVLAPSPPATIEPVGIPEQQTEVTVSQGKKESSPQIISLPDSSPQKTSDLVNTQQQTEETVQEKISAGEETKTQEGTLLAKKEEPGVEEYLKSLEPKVESTEPGYPFKNLKGECLFFHAKWNFVSVGKAMMVCQEEQSKFGRVYHLVGITVPGGLFARMGYGYNRVDAYVNPETFQPYYFYTYTRMGKTERTTEVEFNNKEKLFTWVGKKYKEGKLTETKSGKTAFSCSVYDSIGVFYKLRMDDFKSGKEMKYLVAITKIWTLTVRYRTKITKNLPALGVKNLLLLEPEASSDEGLFTKGKVFLWLTADENRLPVYFHGKIVLGSANLELISTKRLEESMVLNQQTLSSLLSSI